MKIYVVNPGDTLYGIAQSFGVSPTLLAFNNGINGPLVPGQSLVILNPTVIHTVRTGETLRSIADSYGKSLRQIFRNNYYLRGNSRIYPGQSIVIEYEDNPTYRIQTNGYAYTNVNRGILLSALPYMTYLSPFTYGMTEYGGLVELDDNGLIYLASTLGTKSLMHLSTLTENDGFDSNLATAVLNDSSAQQRLISEIERTISAKGFSGIDVDFEFIGGENASAYGEFLRELSFRIDPVISAAAPKTSSEQRGSLYEGHDYRILGENSDFVFVMTYEWGYTYGPPLAVAPLPQVRKVLEYALTEIPREKIWMGIPNYGYDWTLPYVQGESMARSIGNAEAVEIARLRGVNISYDKTSESPYFEYTDDTGRNHIVWFEDARSINAKFDLLTELGLSGIGCWNLMRPFPQMWLIQNSKFVLDG